MSDQPYATAITRLVTAGRAVLVWNCERTNNHLEVMLELRDAIGAIDPKHSSVVAHHLAVIAAGFAVLRSRGDINTKESIDFLQTAFPTPTTHDHH